MSPGGDPASPPPTAELSVLWFAVVDHLPPRQSMPPELQHRYEELGVNPADYAEERVASTREMAGEVVDHIERLVADEGWRLFAISFRDVAIATPSFVDEMVKRLTGLRVSIVLVEMNFDVSEVVGMVLERQPTPTGLRLG